jgi:hypothetical protein
MPHLRLAKMPPHLPPMLLLKAMQHPQLRQQQ